jgi:multiple sugar transport system permease protein
VRRDSRPFFAPLAVNALLVVGAALTMAPLVWMVSASVMPTGEASSFPPGFIPSRITFEHYRDLFQRLSLGRAFGSSLLLASSVTFCSVILNSMAGYAFAKLRFPGRDRLFRILLLGMVIPVQIAMLPLFLLMRSLGLVNTYLGVILPSAAGIFGIFLVRQFARSIPDELLDAARVDGASEWVIYRRLVLPLLKPVLVTLGVFMFLGTWNDFLWPLVVLTDDTKYTLPVALANLVGEHAQDTELMMAGSVLTVLPVLLLFLGLQRAYIEGITAGGLKE